MAKLVKKYMKVFGNAAGANQIGKFGSLAAGLPAYTTDPNQIQTAEYEVGWYGAILGNNSPAIQDVNALDYLYGYQLAYLMQAGVAEWDAVTPYYIGSIANVGGILYKSITDNNVNNLVTDVAHWCPYSSDPTGTGKDFWGASLPPGFVYASGLTIGDTGSNATERENPDTEALFNLLWAGYSDGILPIFDSAGSPSTRGGSAAADFAALKAVSVPDKRGRVSAGRDDMGGSTAGRLTAASGITGTTLGAAGGVETYALSIGEMPSHNHGVTDPTHVHPQLTFEAVSNGGTRPIGFLNTTGPATFAFNTGAAATGISINANGGGGAHQNVQPTIVCNYIIKL